ncbi:hypothetical protein [Nonomuraea sp. NPDC049709]|uniref:hypothetical protein n=1 Tax=Nonomuraea sp. NPDC049709 TaxID=3154736 RepID=UPI0034250F33
MREWAKPLASRDRVGPGAAWDLLGVAVDGEPVGVAISPVERVGALTSRGVRVIAEGRYRTEDHVRQAFAAGAWAVVVGGAITDPVSITRRLAAAAPR